MTGNSITYLDLYYRKIRK